MGRAGWGLPVTFEDHSSLKVIAMSTLNRCLGLMGETEKIGYIYFRQRRETRHMTDVYTNNIDTVKECQMFFCFEMPSTLLKKRVEKCQKQYQNHQNTVCQIVNNFKPYS